MNERSGSSPTCSSICITLETQADVTTAEISLTYQVFNAWWRPRYARAVLLSVHANA